MSNDKITNDFEFVTFTVDTDAAVSNPENRSLADKMKDAAEFCQLLQVRLDNMQHHGHPSACIYSFSSGQIIG